MVRTNARKTKIRARGGNFQKRRYITCEGGEWQRKRARPEEFSTIRSPIISRRSTRSISRKRALWMISFAPWAKPHSPGSQVGDAADVLEAMARDKDCFIVMTLAGAMTVAKMGLIFCDLIESGIVRAIVSTGALMAHGLVEATGRSHFRYDPKMDDRELFFAGYNRVYDSLEPEINLDHVEEVVDHVLVNWDPAEIVGSWKLHRRIGEYLQKHAKGRGILKSAAAHNAPIFVPAFSDSELGIDFALYNRLRRREGKPVLRLIPSKISNTMLKRC